MADAYIRYIKNGVRHHTTGDSLQEATRIFNIISDNVKYGVLNPYVCGELETVDNMYSHPGDIIKIELIKRKTKYKIRKSIEFEVIGTTPVMIFPIIAYNILSVLLINKYQYIPYKDIPFKYRRYGERS